MRPTQLYVTLLFSLTLVLPGCNHSEPVTQTTIAQKSAKTPEPTTPEKEAGEPVSTEGPPLTIFIPRPSESIAANQNEILVDAIQHPARPIKEQNLNSNNSPSILEKLGRLSVHRSEDGESSMVEYQFKDKSRAAKKADARTNRGTIEAELSENSKAGLPVIEELIDRQKP